MLFRGVEVVGGDRIDGDDPELPASLEEQPAAEIEIPVAEGAAHVYTECARIWNPIHTDAAVAARAGLPAIILHGTATLALAVSRVVDHEFEGRADAVGRIAGRFGAMVQMPSTLLLQIFPPRAGVVRFAVANDRGERALRDGLVALRDALASH
jgi:acyl dehydratase